MSRNVQIMIHFLNAGKGCWGVLDYKAAKCEGVRGVRFMLENRRISYVDWVASTEILIAILPPTA